MKEKQIKVGQVYAAKVTGKVVPVRIHKKRSASNGGGWDATNLHTNRPVHIKSAERLRNPISVPKNQSSNGNAKTKAKKPKAPVKKKLTKRERDARRATKKATVKTKPGLPRTRGRISATTRADRGALTKAVAKLPISKGHIAFGRNGDIYELYFRAHNGSPAVWKVKAVVVLDGDGYRSDQAVLLHTGADAVRQTVKTATGRTPSQIGISLGKWKTATGGTKKNAASPRKLSLIDAAVQVLAQSKEPMSCRQIVEQVMAKGLWTTQAPTPHATLSSAILREIQKSGSHPTRFQKVGRGLFLLAKGA